LGEYRWATTEVVCQENVIIQNIDAKTVKKLTTRPTDVENKGFKFGKAIAYIKM
jgi:hypothetical protein